jgi:hypothetical protein
MSENREPHPAPATTDQYGQRQISPQPDPAHTVTNFGRPYEPQTETQER